MRLNNIYINNFGIYKGSYEYDFSVTPDKNVILVSGRNGSGKTTLLNVVKLSIYGPKLFGSMTTQNKQYLSYIESNLNAFARHEGAKDFRVGISFSMFYENSFKEFNITRSWYFQENKLKESTSISIDNIPLEDKEINLVLNVIHREVPKTLFELFFFDGEKINDMFNLKDDLSDMLNHIYNLNLFLDLKRDLRSYKGRISTTKELSECETNILKTEEKLQLLTNEIRTLENTINEETIHLDQLKEELHITKEGFHASGGLNSQEQITLKKQIGVLESKKSDLESQYKQLVELLPFIIMTPQLREIAVQVKQENDAKNYSIISNNIDNQDIKNHLLKSLPLQDIDQVLESIKNFAISRCTATSHYDFSANDELLLNKVLKIIKPLSHESLEECIKKISTINTQLRDLNTQLEESTSKELSIYSVKISTLSNEIGNTETRIYNLQEQKNNNLAKQKDLHNQLHNLHKIRKDLHKEGNLETVIYKIESIIEEYIKRLKSVKQKQFEKIISKMFTTLIRKEDFISGIHINEETGEILIFNKLGGILPKENLSAGERQIYILSILYGIIKLSKNKVPLVFDTLLGRLDHTHKTHIVDSFIKQCGEQVIILATDTEIDEEYLQLLKPLMNHYYKIDYNSVTNTVIHHELAID